jgi:N-acylneuraminate cytidylyltransferase/CMP-N,N'-diacetyllegionaminic acid synthase
MILGSICMRKGSKGVPRKNIRPLLDKPLMVYTFECAKESKRIEEIAISSNDSEILNMAVDNGIKYVFKRNEALSSDSASKWDVFRDLVLRFEKSTKTKIDYIVDLDVTVPRRKPEHIDSSIEMMMNNNVDVVITGYQPERNPYFNMMEVNPNKIATLVKKIEKPIVCRQDAPLVYSLTPAVYVVRRNALFNYQHWSEATCMINPIPREYAIDIDTELDFEFVEYLMKKELRDG